MIAVSNASDSDPELGVPRAALRDKRLSRAFVMLARLTEPGAEMDACLAVGGRCDPAIDQIHLRGWNEFAGELKMRMAGILRHDLAGCDLGDG